MRKARPFSILSALLLISLFSASLPTMAFAQTIRDVTVEASGTCPQDQVLLRLNPVLGDGSAVSLQRRMGTPARANVQLFRSSSLNSALGQNQTLGFDDDVEVLLGAQIGQTGPALVRRMRNPICGWINVGDIERFTAPLRLIDIPGFQNEKDRIGKGGNRLIGRVVVKNRINRQTGYGERAPLFNAPFEGSVEPPQSQRRGSIGFFEVLSVFEVRRATGSPCRVFRDSDCFLRVGSTSIGAGNAGMTRTRGWVRGSDVEIWPSALAVYYLPGKEGIKIHLNEVSARIGTPWQEAGSKESILAFEPEGKFSEPRERNIVRFPVIRGTPLLERVHDSQAKKTNLDSSSISYVYEVVFNGQACIEDQMGSKSGCIPEPQIKDQVARLGQAVRAISKIDVLFVVDATESMNPYLKSVIAAIRRHVSEAATRNEWSLRYSVVLYGDYDRKVNGGLDYYAIPFSGANDLSAIDRLQGLGTFQDENHDIPEAPFAALERAASTAKWDPEAAQHLIIWIADHGNRIAGSYTTAAGPLVESKTADTVVRAIKAADAKRQEQNGVATQTRFVAIQVEGGVTSSNTSQQFFLKFRQDAGAIGEGLGEKVFQTVTAPTHMNLQDQVNTLARSISDQITRNVNAFVEARQAVLGALGGDTSQFQNNLAPSALLGSEYLAQLGFTPDKLLELGRRIQLVRNGFVFQSNQRPNLRYWLALRRPEFLDVRLRARALCENIGISDRVGYVEEAILALVRAVTFTEMQPGETVRDFYARVLSVPANRLSLMLDGTPADFLRKWQAMSRQDHDRIIAGVCRRAQLLDYVGNGLLVDDPDRDIVYDANRNTTSLRQGAKISEFDWRWISVDARTEWFFIPLEYLP